MLILNNIFFLWVIISSEIAIFVQVNCKIESFYDPKKEFLCYYDGGDGWEGGCSKLWLRYMVDMVPTITYPTTLVYAIV